MIQIQDLFIASYCILAAIMASQHERAGFPEILRSTQKDQSFINDLDGQVSSVVLKILGPRSWLTWKQWIEASTRFAFYALTTLSDFQTLGEEYTGILQIDSSSSRLKLPSTLSRLSMVALQSFGPVAFSRLFSYLKRKYPTNEKLFAIFEDILNFVHKLNISVFYIEGLFYDLAKRATGIGYVKIRSWGPGDDDQDQFSTRLLKMVSLANIAVISWQFMLKMNRHFKEFHKEAEAFTDESETHPGSVALKDKCPLCLERRKATTCTPCGHLFCWECIHDSIKAKQECPLCKEQISPSRVIPLMNYT